MELNLSTQLVSVNEVVYDGTCEQPLECDVLLPDDCPDIQKILRCEVTPALLAATAAGGKLTIDGMAVAHLYYLDEAGCIRHAEYKIPYSKAVELRAAPACPNVTVSQGVDYFNCRAVSPRRLDMRGAVSICAKVTGQSEEQVVCGAGEGGLQFWRETAENVKLLPQAVRQLSVREELELGYGKPAVGGVIRCTASAVVSDYKVIAGKVVTKGEVAVRILYRCEEDPKQLEVMEYTLPVSQIIDLDGVDEDCACEVWYDVCTVEAIPKPNAEGENRAFLLEVSANACANAVRRVELEAACDCYSTQYECKQTARPVTFLRLVDVVDEGCAYQEVLELPEGVESVVDLWCVAGTPAVRMDGDSAVVSGKLTVCMLVREGEGEIAYYDQAREYSQRVPAREAADGILFTPRVCAGAAAFSLSGRDKLEVRCTVRVQGCLYSQYRKKVLCDVALDETRPKTRRDNVLYLYYASEKEPVWEIAKRYNTSVEAIQAGNQLEDSVLAGKTMLLIPMK